MSSVEDVWRVNYDLCFPQRIRGFVYNLGVLIFNILKLHYFSILQYLFRKQINVDSVNMKGANHPFQS